MNARTVCGLAGRPDIAVFKGAGRPLELLVLAVEYVHRATGLDGPDLPAPMMPLQHGHAVNFVLEALRGAGDGETTPARRARSTTLRWRSAAQRNCCTISARSKAWAAVAALLDRFVRFDEAKYGTDSGSLHDLK